MTSKQNYENAESYGKFYDSNFDPSSINQMNIDRISEYSDDYTFRSTSTFSGYDEQLSDSLFGDELSSNISFCDTISSLYDCNGSLCAVTPSISEESNESNTQLSNKPVKKLNGILKTRSSSFGENNNNNTSITNDTIEKIRESELEDILQYAKDIMNPDPSAHMTYSSQPVKVIPGTFQHLLSVKEINSKTGAFKYRTIEIIRKNDKEDLGFSIRQGDGWEKNDGIYISRISLGSIFDQYEILKIGDEIIRINKVEVKYMNVEDVVRLLHIPEKLSITVKILTPFSQKRVEQSDINKLRFIEQQRQQKIIPNSISMENMYKIAHLKITKNSSRGKNNHHQQKQQHPKRTILVKKSPSPSNSDKESKTVKISPYRSMENGQTTALINRSHLSPIREAISDTQLNKTPNMNRRQSYVTWSDQRSVKSNMF